MTIDDVRCDAAAFEFHALDRGRMHYAEAGAGEPILLLHGNPTWCFLYRNILPQLARRWRVIAPDHLGFGLSDKPPDAPYDLRWHVENLSAFILERGLDELTLVLHDWGGPIGLGFAIRHPERVRRLVILNTWAFRLPEGAKLPRLLELARQPGVGEDLVLEQNLMVERGIPEGVFHRSRMTARTMSCYRAPFPDPESRRSVLAMVRDIPLGGQGPSAALMGEIQDGLPRLRVPAAIIWGEQDPVFSPAVADLWRLYFPDARVHRLAEASHFLQEDAPETISALIAELMEETG